MTCNRMNHVFVSRQGHFNSSFMYLSFFLFLSKPGHRGMDAIIFHTLVKHHEKYLNILSINMEHVLTVCGDDVIKYSL